jgi:hypothetical protein
MRSDLLKNLFQAYAESDNDKFIGAANEIIRDEERKKHSLLAKDLKDIILTAPQTTFKSNAFSGSLPILS